MALGADTRRIYAQMPGGFTPQPGGVTPVSPQPGNPPPIEIPAPAPQPSGSGGGPERGTHFLESRSKLPLIAIAVVVILAIVAVVYIKFTPHNAVTTTTIPVTSLTSISSCRSITSPGNYTFSGGILTSILSGACINVTASNVNINCLGYPLTGSGPYSGVPPFSYGIALHGNDSGLENCHISNFSYGAYASHASNINIHNDNISSNYMSNIYLDNVSGSNVYQNTLLHSTSSNGALYLSRGSSNNRVYNNSVNNNLNYGIGINATGNLFYDNKVGGNPSAFYCSASGGLSSSNKAYGNTCYNNTGCSFVECSGFNLVTNISNIALTGGVDSCGSINNPGVYTLQGSLDMGRFINTSNPLASATGISCIYIRSNDVKLNCAGSSILNATTAILASGVSNITVSNCTISDKVYGVSFSNVSNSKIYNTSASGGAAGIYLAGSSIDFLTNVAALNNDYGILLSNSTTDTVSKFTANNNTFGLYLSNSTGNIFNGGKALNNSNIDVYASSDSANASYNFMSTTSCGYTNAAWASCKVKVSTNLQYTAVTSCSTLSRSGNYLITAPLIGTSITCIRIAASNVTLSCNGNRIGSAIATTKGYAISMNGVSNVGIRGCILSNFAYGINVTASSNVVISNTTDRLSGYGISFKNVSGSSISNSTFYNTTYYGILLSNSQGNRMTYNNVSYDYGPGAAISLNNSTRNILKDNVGYSSYYGIRITGASQNNTVSNNNMFGSDYYDYACSPQNNAVNAEHGGVNYGGNKEGCNWLAVIPVGYSGMDCRAFFSSNYRSFSTDQLYTTGTKCYTVYANSTTLDCKGHTVIASNGGTLMALNGSAGSTIENCIFRGFTSVVSGVNSRVNLINDTIYTNSTAGQPAVPIVSLVGGTSPQISNNNISTPYYGIYLSNVTRGSISNNRVTAGVAAYSLYNVTGTDLQGNIAWPSSGIGLIMNGSTEDTFQNNNFSGVALGMECTGGSVPSHSSVDLGGNACSSQSQCNWINASAAACRP